MKTTGSDTKILPTAKRLRRQAGVTAIELIIVLAVIGAIIAGVATTSQGLFRSNALTEDARFISQSAARLRAFYSSLPGRATGLTTPNAIASGAIEADRVSGSAIISRVSSMAINVGEASLGGEAGNAFVISYTGAVTEAVCSEFLTKVGNLAPLVVTNSATAKSDAAWSVGWPAQGTAVTARADAAVAVTPMSQASITAACTGGAAQIHLVFPLGT